MQQSMLEQTSVHLLNLTKDLELYKGHITVFLIFC